MTFARSRYEVIEHDGFLEQATAIFGSVRHWNDILAALTWTIERHRPHIFPVAMPGSRRNVEIRVITILPLGDAPALEILYSVSDSTGTVSLLQIIQPMP